MKKKQIVLFDDNLFFRNSIAMLFADREDFGLAAAFEDANDLENNIKSSQPDIVLMDIDMPGTNGIEAVKILRKNFPSLPVIMLTQYDHEDKIIASICAGANGYLLKTASGDNITDRMNEVLNGGASLDPAIARRVLNLFSEKFSAPGIEESFMLSRREKDVLNLLVQGNPYKVIAIELGITYDTVRAHIKNIYKKLQVSTVSGAVAKAINFHIVSGN